MKRLLSIFLAAVMLLGVMPWQVFAEGTESKQEVTYPLTLKVYNPDDGSFKEKTFNSENDLLGFGINGGRSDWTYRTFRKLFFGWSIDKKFENSTPSQSMKPEDKIYRDIEPISAIEGLKNDSILYPIIMPVTDLMAFAAMLETGGGTLYINGEKTEKDVSEEETAKDNFIKRTEGFEDKDAEKRLIEYYLDPEKEEYEIQAVSEFYFKDPRVPFVIVENPLGIVKSAKGVTDFTGKSPQNYSYEDLTVELDNKMDVAKKQEDWTFESSTFIVSDVLDENYNSLSPTIALPSPDSLVTTFSFDNSKGLKKFIIRTTPRSDNSDAKYGSDINNYPTDNTTVVTGEQILQPMKLKTGKRSNIKISKEYAKELEADKDLESVSKGVIKGAVGIDKRRMTGGAAAIAIFLPDSQPIPKLDSKNTMNFDFATPYARFDRNTKSLGDTEEQNLGYSKFVVKKAMASDGFNQDTQPNKDISQAGEAFISEKDYKVNETKLTFNGKEYTFKGWNTQADGKGDFVDKDTVIKLEDLNQKENDAVEEDITLYAIWETKEEPKPNPTPDSNTAPKISFFVLPEEEEKDTRPREDHLAYIFGYVDKTVRPEGTLTRAEAAAMVTRLGKLDLSDTSKADYPDLRDKAWYLGNINAALRAGMLDTDEKGNLRPDQPVTRAEFIKMVAAIDKAGEGKAPFTDIAGHKYEKEINQVYSNKWIAGYSDGTFKPDAFLSRAEAAAFLNRVFNRVADDVAIQGFEGSIKKFTDLDIKSWCYYELVEATNSHELVRRNGKDAMDRTFEDWTRLLNQ